LERYIETKTLSRAAVLVTVSEPLKCKLQQLHNKPVAVVLNGYDPADYPNYTTEPSSHLPLRIVYTGRIYPGKQDPTPLLSALERLLQSGRISMSEVRVDFYGPNPHAMHGVAKHFPIVRPMLRIHGEVSHTEALALQTAADALLLLAWTNPHEKSLYTGKVFEYLGARRPILAIGPRGGVLDELFEETRPGFSQRPCHRGFSAAPLAQREDALRLLAIRA
jgi:glycosyltransferase involved in cell wall biosynthesis